MFDRLAPSSVANWAWELIPEPMPVLQEFTSHTVDVLTGHGLRPNIGPKKTAALLSVVGPQAREVLKAGVLVRQRRPAGATRARSRFLAFDSCAVPTPRVNSVF